MARTGRRTHDPLSRELLELRRVLASRAGGAALPRPHESADQFYARARRTHRGSAHGLHGIDHQLTRRGRRRRSRLLWRVALLVALLVALTVGLFVAGALIS